ncbi:MAG: DUF2067 family protein [Candidatus Heimdallarchaeota archaeon]
MARWTSKEIVIPIDNTQEAILFLEAVQKQIKMVDIFADYYPGKVNIRFEGSKDNLQEAIDITKRIHLITQNMLYPDQNGFFKYDIGHLSRTTGKTFPIKILVKVLTLDGFEATKKENNIISKIEFEKLQVVINKIDETISSIPYEVTTNNLRDVITIIALVKKITVEKAVALAKKTDIVKEDELQRLTLKFEQDQALEKCLKITK